MLRSGQNRLTPRPQSGAGILDHKPPPPPAPDIDAPLLSFKLKQHAKNVMNNGQRPAVLPNPGHSTRAALAEPRETLGVKVEAK